MRTFREHAKLLRLPAGFHLSSGAPGRAGVAIVAGFVAFAVVASVTAPDVSAATVVQTWQTRIGAKNALNDTATIQVYDTTKGALRIRATKLRASSVYTVTLYRGRCGFMASVLYRMPSVTTNSSGNVSKNASEVIVDALAVLHRRWKVEPPGRSHAMIEITPERDRSSAQPRQSALPQNAQTTVAGTSRRSSRDAGVTDSLACCSSSSAAES